MNIRNIIINITKQQFIKICCLLWLLLLSHEIYAESVTLTWDASQKPGVDVSGFMIYYGTESGNYAYPPIDVGNATIYTIEDLDGDEVYYFAVTAYARDVAIW